MSTDANFLRDRLKSLSGQNKTTTNIWKPKPGEHTVRIIPSKKDPKTPFVELLFYYGLNKRTFLSPAVKDEYDPVLDFVNKQKRTGNRDDWELARSIEPKLRTYVEILVRGKESEGVKWWGFGKQVYAALLGILTDPDWEDSVDLEKGHDIKVIVTEEPGKQYPTISIQAKPKASAVLPADQMHLLEKRVDIFDIYTVATPEELKEAMQKHLNPEPEDKDANADASVGQTAQDDAVDPSVHSESEKHSEKQPAKGSSESNNTFDEIFSRKTGV